MRHMYRTDEVTGAKTLIIVPEEDPSWRQSAACRGLDPSLFYPERGIMQTYLKEEVCGRCPVKQECLEYGLEEDHGIWGGLSVRERKALRRQRKAASNG